MEQVTLDVAIRKQSGSRAAKRLRNEGFIPAEVYGHKKKNISVAVNRDEFLKHLRSEGARLFTLNVKGKKETVILKEIQYDHLGKDIVHLDLERVTKDEKITITVPVELHGTPKGLREGGMLDQVGKELEIECTPLNMPENITVEVAELSVNEHLSVADITPPEGVKILAEPTTVLVVIHPPKEAVEEEEVVEAEELLKEPEVIERGKAKEEEEEESEKE